MKNWKWFKLALILLIIAFIAGWYIPATANQQNQPVKQAIVDAIVHFKYGTFVLTKTGSCLMSQVTVMQIDDPDGIYKYWYFTGAEAYMNVDALERNAWLTLDAIERDNCA